MQILERVDGLRLYACARDLSSFFAGDEQKLELSRFAIAQVERRLTDATTDLAWTSVGDEVRLDLSVPSTLGDVCYSGRVPLPAREGHELRLALREYEIFLTDESEAEDHLVRPSLFGDFQPVSRPIRYRLVYADYLGL